MRSSCFCELRVNSSQAIILSICFDLSNSVVEAFSFIIRQSSVFAAKHFAKRLAIGKHALVDAIDSVAWNLEKVRVDLKANHSPPM
jgi:hypothetical protein